MSQNENIMLESLERIEKIITSLHISILPTTEKIEDLLKKQKKITDEIPSFLRRHN